MSYGYVLNYDLRSLSRGSVRVLDLSRVCVAVWGVHAIVVVRRAVRVLRIIDRTILVRAVRVSVSAILV